MKTSPNRPARTPAQTRVFTKRVREPLQPTRWLRTSTIIAVFVLATFTPELIATQCVYKDIDYVSCTTADCSCVFFTPNGQAECVGHQPSWVRGDLGDARTRCKGTGSLYLENLINNGCGKMFAQFTNCVWNLGKCDCPPRNEVLDQAVMVDPQNQWQRAKTECLPCEAP